MAEKWFDDKFDTRKKKDLTYGRRRSENVFRKLSLTNLIIIFNLIVYFLIIFSLASFGEERILSIFALSPNDFFSGSIWQVVTSMFSHIWFPHLLFNMISLFFIGNFVENIIGRKRLLRFYLLSGIFAGLFYAVLSFYFGTGIGERIFLNPDVSAVGASGAIFALLGLMAVLTPHTKIYLIVGPLIAIIIGAIFSQIFPGAGFLAVLNLLINFYFIISIVSIFSFNPTMRKIAVPLEMPIWVLPIVAIVPLVIIGLFVELPIGNTAHLGGLIAGLGYGWFMIRRYKKKIVMVRKYFSRY